MLKIYNSLTGEKQEFKPLVPGKIGIYVCGNTVYDYCHIGHARSMIMFDVVVRYLRSQGYEVTHVRNITDIDDKIIKRALENNEPIDALTRRFIDAQREDEKALGLLTPTHEPRATEFIPQMLDLIQKLMDHGYAYVAKTGEEQGDVLFDVRKFKDYGKLSGNTIEKLLSTNDVGKKIIEAAHKADPLDFALWKISKPGEPHWPSPWGEGRPGWHIECSAMSISLLGQPFDIHGGGMDLKFPHHENEIAQSEAASGEQFAKLWMHVGLLLVDGAKMSKSLHNFITLRDALKNYHPEELRFFMMKSHYRRPADFSEKNLYETKVLLKRYYDAISDVPNPSGNTGETPEAVEALEKFNSYMDDDFSNTTALAHLGDVCGRVRILKQTPGQMNEAIILCAAVRKMAEILGILQDPNYLLGDESLGKKIDELRIQKQWGEADKLRQQLLDQGYEVKTTTTGTKVFRK